ncbi:MAG: CoA ester lyase [Gammaproteobacteria bacterium]|nr:CoA ester lyase [Gammaproteobacteria bacterium]
MALMRSYLFAPGNHPRKLEKVFNCGADAVLIDLEDSVAVSEKTVTRALAVAALQKPRSARGYIRINALDTPWCIDDLAAVVSPWIDGIILPKTESVEQLRFVSAQIAIYEQRLDMAIGKLELLPIVETARGIEAATDIAAADQRIVRLAFGGGDYTNDLNLEWTEDERELAYARARLTHASRIARIQPPIDTVVVQIKDQARFIRSARNGRQMGFSGKLCIHPDQVEPCNQVFSPSEDQILNAIAVVQAFERAEVLGSASIQVDGQFIDYPIVEQARRLLRIAGKI